MSMRFGSVPVLVISSANAAEQALKTQDLAFSGRPASISAQKFSYNGLDFAFRSYGQAVLERDEKDFCSASL